MVIKMRILSESFKLCSSILANRMDPLRLALGSIDPNHFCKVAIPQEKYSLLSSGLVILVVAEAVTDGRLWLLLVEGMDGRCKM